MYFWSDDKMVNILRVNPSGIVSLLEPNHTDYHEAVGFRPNPAQVLSVFNTEATVSPDKIRAQRDSLLLTVDAIAGNALRWAALDADTQAAWATYRQALLDVPQQAGFPHNITWPTEPQGV